jgi:hypothetical protein
LKANFRGKWKLSGQIRALEEERELRGRDAQWSTLWGTEDVGEYTLGQGLAVDAQPGAVPEQDLARAAPAVDEEEGVAIERIAVELPDDDAEQAVLAVAQVRRSSASEDAHRSGGADHRRAFIATSACSKDSPYEAKPLGESKRSSLSVELGRGWVGSGVGRAPPSS